MIGAHSAWMKRRFSGIIACSSLVLTAACQPALYQLTEESTPAPPRQISADELRSSSERVSSSTLLSQPQPADPAERAEVDVVSLPQPVSEPAALAPLPQSLPASEQVAGRSPGVTSLGGAELGSNQFRRITPAQNQVSGDLTRDTSIQPLSPEGLTRGGPDQAFDREDYNPIQENDFIRVQDDPLSTFSIDVDAASYSNVRRFITSGQRPPADAVRIEEMINYFTYDYPNPTGEVPFTVVTEISQAPWNPQHQLVHIGLQGQRLATEDLPPSNLVFLLDVSGSMNDPSKLPLLKSAFRLLVDELDAEDRVSIVVYAGAAGVVLEPTPGDEKLQILAAIERLQAGGSTAGGEGIERAYELARENFLAKGNNRVILATDGDFNVGISSEGELVRLIEEKREDDIFLTVLGFGSGNLQDAKMEQLANHGNGNYAYIDSLQEARKVMVNELGATLFSIAKDVKLQIEFNPAQVQGYRLIGYENRVLQHHEFNDDTKDAGELGAGHSVTALYEIIPTGVESSMDLPDVDPLRYQQRVPEQEEVNPQELMWVKLRYKRPTADVSQKLEHPVMNWSLPSDQTTDDFRFSAAVAGFGMVLRDSQYKGSADPELILDLATAALGEDRGGYRREFVELVRQYRDLE